MNKVRFIVSLATVAGLGLCLFLVVAEPGQAEDSSVGAPNDTVIMIHGMNRSRAAMVVMQVRFEIEGYRPLNFPYLNTVDSLDEISDSLISYIRENVQTPRYHLVAHSLGNIIIRNAFKKGLPQGLGRIVMLAPPNHPNTMARLLKENFLYQLIAGDSGQKLSQEEFFRTLPVPPVEFGIIAGDWSLSPVFDVPNDGKVAVSAARLEGMKDFIVINRSHTFLMNTEDTFELTRRFIETGSFR
ncbi:MAG: hypothetical protein QGH40_11130 [bacterium]|jgi:hypothetical protein|nr:hypothetical protein [bacterium]